MEGSPRARDDFDLVPMRSHERNIRDYLERHLSDSGLDGSKRIPSLRAFVDGEQERLLEHHRAGLGGREIARRRSDLVDAVVSRAGRMVADDLGPDAAKDLAACSVVALGGYGRGELSPYSDVDILLLHPERMTPVWKAFAESLLPLLWDVGLRVGHSFRSVDDCLAMARRRIDSG